MKKAALITGGAGFIGSHVADELLSAGYQVRVLDNFSIVTHGAGQRRPVFMNPETELMIGDVQDPEAVRTGAQRH